MALCRTQLRRLVLAVLVHLYAVHCYAASLTETTLSVCDYTLKNLYVVNTTATSTLFPTGYMSCVNATGSDARLCEICSCRENKVGVAAGVALAGVVCVGSRDATTCVGRNQEYCDCNDSAGCNVGAAFLRDGLSLNEDMSVGDVVSASSSASLINGNDTSAESSSTPSPNSTSDFTAESAIDYAPPIIDTNSSLDASISTSIETSSSDASLNLDTSTPTSIPAIDPGPINPSIDSHSGSTGINVDIAIPVVAPESVSPSIDTGSGSTGINVVTSNTDSASGPADSSSHTDSSSSDSSSSSTTSIDADTSSTDSTSKSTIGFGSKMTGSTVEKDNVVSDVVSTAKPSQTDAASSTSQNVIRSQDNGSTVDTNNGSSSNSSWSGGRLTAMLSAMCGIGVVAAITALIVMRRGQSKNDNDLGTPMDDYADDDTSVTPTSHGKRRYYSGGNRVDGSFKNTPLASIAVIGSNDAFLTPPSSASKHQYRSYPGADRYASEHGCARTDSSIAGKDMVMRDSRPSTQQQLLVSHGPSISSLQSPTSNSIFDTSNTRESFSSGMSSQFESSLDERVYDSEASFNSFRIAFDTSCGTECDSDTLTNSSDRPALSDPESERDAAASSLSSLESVQYDIRDTEASEHMHESEMDTNSSRIAISFDMDCIDYEGLPTSP